MPAAIYWSDTGDRRRFDHLHRLDAVRAELVFRKIAIDSHRIFEFHRQHTCSP